MKFFVLFFLFLTCWLTADEVDILLDQEQSEQTGQAITIIFDDSGSMQDRGKMRQAKEAFYTWLQAQTNDTRFSLIHFENKGKIAVPLGLHTKDAVLKLVKSLRPRYNTPIVNCLRLAAEQIQKRRQEVSPYERHIIVVFTDGAETVDRGGNRAVAEAIHQIVTQGAGVEVVGIGFHGEGDYMAKSATSFYTADNASELLQSLEKVSAEVPATAEFELSRAEEKLMANMDFQSQELSPAAVTPPPSNIPSSSGRGTGFSLFGAFIAFGLVIIGLKVLKKLF